MLQDLRFAVRLLVKERWFSAVAVLALALGIGVNATGFTLVNAAFIRGLPFEDADRLYMLSWQPRSGPRVNLSAPELQDWREQSHSFTGLAAFDSDSMNVSDERALPEQVRGAWVTANLFGLLGQRPLLGRDFAPGDDRKGAEPVVIVGSALWKDRYGSDPGIVGKSLRVNGQLATIVGVMPEAMKFPSNTELWAPFVPTPAQERRDVRRLATFGRLAPGITVQEAQTELNGIAQRMAATYPDTNKDLLRARVETFTERFVGGKGRRMLTITMGAVIFVLLIACGNVANLLLSRSAHRSREVAIRIALGATRWRVVRQLLLESVVLGLIGGALGLLLATAGVRAIEAAVQDPGRPYWITFTVDWVVFGYVAAVCVLTGVLFGLAPALHVSGTNLNEALKEGGRRGAGNRRALRLSGAMVVMELALTIVMLAGAGLMVRSFVKMYALDVGFASEHLMAMSVQLPDTKYPSPDVRRGFFERLEPRLQGLPGVEAVAVTTSVPPFGAEERPVEIDGRPQDAGLKPPNVATVAISPGFFDVLGLKLLRGRAFQEADGATSSGAVIVNERLATQYFGTDDPIGRRLRFADGEAVGGQAGAAWMTVVGVSPSLRHSSPQEAEPNAVVYVPYRQEPPDEASLLVRSTLPQASLMEAVRREVQAVDPDQPVFTVQTLEQMLAQARWPFRVFGGLFAIFAAIALVLASVGLYSVTAYAVTQRTHEIGVRMAVGAGAPQITWLILRRGLTHLGAGLAVGLAGAWALSRVLQRVIVQISSNDPLTFATITLVLTVVSIAACLIPARRATQVDPLVALRAE